MTAATAVAAERAMVGQPAPDFEMASTKNVEKLNEPVKLSDYRGKWLVLVFYPLDFTFVCPTELTTFSDRYQDFVDIGADIIGISTDSVYSHRAWLNTSRDKGGVEGLKYPLAADATKQVRAARGRGLCVLRLDVPGARREVVEPNQVDVVTGAVSGGFEQILHAVETRFARQIVGDIRQANRSD